MNKFGKLKGGSNRPQFKKKKWHVSSSSSAHEPRNEGEHHAITRKISLLDQHSLKVVWQKKVVGLVYALSVVETTNVNVVRDR